MKKVEIFVDERAAIQTGLSALMRYNSCMWIPLDKEQISCEAIEDFFKAKVGSEREQSLAKLLCIAAKDTYYTHPDIPKKNRDICANRGAKEFHFALEGAKNDYLKEMGFFGCGTEAEIKYNQAQKGNTLVRNAAAVEMAKKRLKNLPANMLKKQSVKAFISAAVSTLGFQSVASGTLATAAAALGIPATVLTGGATILAMPIIYTAVDTAIAMIPENAKKKMKETCKDTFQKATAQVDNAVKMLSQTTIGKKVTKVVDTYVQPVLTKGIDKVITLVEKGKSFCNKVKTRAKSHLA